MQQRPGLQAAFRLSMKRGAAKHGVPRGSKMVPSSSKSCLLGTCSNPPKLSPETHDVCRWDAQLPFCPVMCPIWDAPGRWEFLPTITQSRGLLPIKNEKHKIAKNQSEKKCFQRVVTSKNPTGFQSACPRDSCPQSRIEHQQFVPTHTPTHSGSNQIRLLL